MFDIFLVEDGAGRSATVATGETIGIFENLIMKITHPHIEVGWEVTFELIEEASVGFLKHYTSFTNGFGLIFWVC